MNIFISTDPNFSLVSDFSPSNKNPSVFSSQQIYSYSENNSKFRHVFPPILKVLHLPFQPSSLTHFQTTFLFLYGPISYLKMTQTGILSCAYIPSPFLPIFLNIFLCISHLPFSVISDKTQSIFSVLPQMPTMPWILSFNFSTKYSFPLL